MNRTSQLFKFQNISLYYTISGTGSKPIFLFHGFGLSGKIFFELEEVFSSQYTLYNFDLPFHGQSHWQGEAPITEIFWKNFLEEFCRQKNIEKFSLLGYSIGCRLLWASVNSCPAKIEEVIAIAPDGIKSSFWYRLATSSAVSRFLFKTTLFKNYIPAILTIGKFLHLAPKITVRFAESQLMTAEQRDRVYYTWINFRELKVHEIKTSAMINLYRIKVSIYLGEQDKIITAKTIEPLVQKLENKNVITLQAGHSNLVGKLVEYLRSDLNKRS
jgi:pimeloyl-ACP methyl ester carboxylesterase